jgi:hypothetical protein
LEKNKTIWGYNAVVDGEKFNQKKYMILAKRSTQPVGKQINKIADFTVEKMGEKIGIDVLSVSYLHGVYDVAVVFMTDDIIKVKKFKEIILRELGDLLEEIEILEYIFLLREGGITNPEIDKLRDFF